MFHDTLTNEDTAIFQRAASRNREYLPADYMVMMGDSTDYRAMTAREVYKEREWRIHDRIVTPVDIQHCDNLNAWQPERFMNLRERMERINGEPL